MFWCVVSSYLVLSRPIVESRPTQHKQQARSLCSGGGKRQIVESRLSQQKQQTRAAYKTAEVTSPLPLLGGWQVPDTHLALASRSKQARSLCSGGGKRQIVESRLSQQKQQTRAANKTAEVTSPLPLSGSGKCQIVASRPTQRKQQARAASKTAEASLPISLAASAQQQSNSGKHNNASAAAISSPLPYLQRVIYCCRASLLPTLL